MSWEIVQQLFEAVDSGAEAHRFFKTEQDVREVNWLIFGMIAKRGERFSDYSCQIYPAKLFPDDPEGYVLSLARKPQIVLRPPEES